MAEAQDAPNGAPAPESTAKEEESNKGESWKFIPTQPIREDQVQNAINFLSHPKVKGSPVVYRRSFLERKGLSREEIDEAFRRVPDPPSDAKPVPPTSTTIVSAAPVPGVVPVAATPVAPPPVQSSALVPSRRSSWTQMVVAVGLLSVVGAGAAVATKQYLFPRMKAWLRRIVLDDDEQEAKKSVKGTEVTVVTELTTLIKELASSKTEEKRYYDGLLKNLEAQTLEIKLSLEKQSRDIKQSLDSINGYIRRSNLPVSEGNGSSTHKAMLSDAKATHGSSEQLNNGLTSGPSSAPATHAPHSASYMEIMAMVQRGEKPPGIREVNDKPPNANQVPSYSVLQPKAKPWETLDSAMYRNGKVDSAAELWWRQKDASAVKITEIDGETVSSGYEGGISRSWQPPPAPKAVLPGVDAAIRPKIPSVEPVVEPSESEESSEDNTPSQVEQEEETIPGTE